MKKLICLAAAWLLMLPLTACGAIAGLLEGSGSGGSDGSSAQAARWPQEIYSRYGISEISTAGQLVYAEPADEGSYQYEVCYDGVTREELLAWTNALFAAGFRASDRDRERLEKAAYDHDVMIYCEKEQQPYRMRLSFDFEHPMTFEYYDEDDHGFVVHEETDDYGDSYRYIQYNLAVSLNPMNTEEEYSGSLSALGLSAEDLRGVNGVRSVRIGEAAVTSSLNFHFYADHVTTQEELEACRVLLIDKLAAAGAKFYDAFASDTELSADALKASGKGTYLVVRGGSTFFIMVNPDSAFGDFGDGFGVMITKRS